MPDDLSTFASARWAPLVRTYVALGPGVEHAARLAETTLGRVVLDHRRDGSDADDRLAEAVVETWRDEGRTWWRDAPAPHAPGAAWGRLEAEVDRLGQDDRLALALGAGLRLSDDSVRDLLDVEPASVDLVERSAVALAGLAIAPRPEGSLAPQPARGRRRGRVVTVAVLVLVLVAAAWNVVTDDDGSPGPGRVQGAENPLPAAWYADGRLHLDDVVVVMPGVVSLAAWTGGAVTADADGRLVAVDDDGAITAVGTTRPGAAYDLEPRLGLLAFIDTAPAGGTAAVNVIDVSTGETRLRQQVAGAQARVVAMDGPVVVQADRRGYTRTHIRTALTKVNTTLIPDRGLIDLAGGSRLFLREGTLTADRTDEDPSLTDRPARLEGVEDAGLSDDGRYAWVRRRGLDELGVLDLVAVGGLRFDLPAHRATPAVSLVRGALAPQAVFVLALDPGRYQLVACLVADGTCDDPVDVDGSDPPLLDG